MLYECIEGLSIKKDGVYVDVTFGGGGHSKAILNELGKEGKLVAFDQDKDAKFNLPDDKRLLFIDQNFSFITNHLQYQGLCPIDGLLADLGVSSHQFDEASRGFSFRFDEALLDMRMNSEGDKTAAGILNEFNEEELTRVLREYGELKNARRLAEAIVKQRSVNVLKTVADLKQALKPFLPRLHDWKFLAQVFQALRIEINDELGALKKLLMQSEAIIKPGGRLVVMSYHSLEDRLVKNFINTGNLDGVTESDFYGKVNKPFDVVSKKAITASEEEVLENPRARSAKLRIGIKR